MSNGFLTMCQSVFSFKCSRFRDLRGCSVHQNPDLPNILSWWENISGQDVKALASDSWLQTNVFVVLLLYKQWNDLMQATIHAESFQMTLLNKTRSWSYLKFFFFSHENTFKSSVACYVLQCLTSLLFCFFIVVFCFEYDRESSDCFTGWTVIRDGPQI